jgi:hypothetical protein
VLYQLSYAPELPGGLYSALARLDGLERLGSIRLPEPFSRHPVKIR